MAGLLNSGVSKLHIIQSEEEPLSIAKLGWYSITHPTALIERLTIGEYAPYLRCL